MNKLVACMAANLNANVTVPYLISIQEYTIIITVKVIKFKFIERNNRQNLSPLTRPKVQLYAHLPN